MSINRPIKILPPEVARKIAAGEVIDRPNAIVRELMDNAIDSGADTISVEIYAGGIDKIRVIDNGNGMSKQDMEIAATSHATSKISTEHDLLNLSTLGFRGEALSSIAAVSKLTIISGDYKLEASAVEKNKISQCQPFSGTIVQSENLFQNFPARRLFLKRAATEGKMCLNTFVEKTLPFFNLDFRFFQDGELKLNLPKEENLLMRFTTAMNYSKEKNLFFTLKNHADDNSWNYELVIGEPGIFRTDRKEISIFVNNRKVNEYSLMQAIEYGCQGYFPNGTHPIAALFVKIDSSLVDFNIHPSKKEVRFKDISVLHHSISETTASFLKNSTIKSLKPELDATYYENTFSKELFESPISESFVKYGSSQKENSRLSQLEKLNIYSSKNSFSKIGEKKYSSDLRSIFMNEQSYTQNLAQFAFQEEKTNLQEKQNLDQNSNYDNVKYFGTTLGVFLLIEQNSTLYLIDQHAAHERIIYDSIMTNSAKSQKLLIPYELETQNQADDEYLESIKEQLESKGFVLCNKGNGTWQITEVHERWTGTEKELSTLILDNKIEPDKILTYIAASTACKAAVKDGYYLDPETAKELAIKALALPDPHCPHGRPIWTAITKEKMFELVKRISK